MKNKKGWFFLAFFILSMSLMSVQPARAIETELLPIEDAYINSYFADDNYGASDYLSVGQLLFGSDVSYIKFNIPENDKVILSATVKTFWYYFALESRMLLGVGTASNSWDEDTITWNNAPYYYIDMIATQLTGDGDWFNFDVLECIPESGVFSIIIFEDGGWSGEYLQSDSRENDIAPDPPVLVIVYETTIEDFLPFILIGVIGATIVGGGIGIVLYMKRKKQRDIGESLEKPSSVVKMCPKCGSRQALSDMQFCTECGQKLK